MNILPERWKKGDIYLDYLYRYTSLENLVMTMKYHTIRLNPLDKMDDIQEKRTRDLQNIGKFIFISSWTEEETEHIPMWNMYTDMISGVRIKLPVNPFKRQGTLVEKIAAFAGGKVTPDSLPMIDSFLDLVELAKLNVATAQAISGDILHKVEYTDNIDLLEPQICSIEGEKIHLETGKIGKFKNVYWSFQKEWRYMMTFVPFDYRLPLEKMQKQFMIMVNKLAIDQVPPPFDHFDLEISDENFAKMEITPSPKMSPGFRLILEDLIEKYNPSARIVESSLNNLI